MKEVDHERIRKEVEYIKGLTKQIEDRIVAACEDLFESSKNREELYITIRISCDFNKLLLDFGETPPQDEAEYVADTMRSGIDSFFLLPMTCRYVSDEAARWSFDRQAISTFRDLRAASLRRFDDLCCPSATGGEMLASLLALVHLELVFMGQTFPSFLHLHSREDQW